MNGTTLKYDPAVSGAPTTFKEGQVVDFETTLAFVVTAQDNNHPFFIGQVMTGCSVTRRQLERADVSATRST